MKNLIMVTIEGPSHNDVEGARKALVDACVQTKDRFSNGSRIRISSCNADDMNQIYSLMGKIKWWTLGKRAENHEPEKKRSLIDKILWGPDDD